MVFRCLAFRQGDEVVFTVQGPGSRWAAIFLRLLPLCWLLPARKFVLDGEIVIHSGAGLDFDALLQRHSSCCQPHPAAFHRKRLQRTWSLIFLSMAEAGLLPTGRSPHERMALQEFAGGQHQ